MNNQSDALTIGFTIMTVTALDHLPKAIVLGTNTEPKSPTLSSNSSESSTIFENNPPITQSVSASASSLPAPKPPPEPC